MVVEDGAVDTSYGDGSGSSAAGAGVPEATPAVMSEGSAAGGDGGDGAAGAEMGTGAEIAPPGEGPPSFLEARRLFELGILADPLHGPLYNAYG